MNLGAIFCKHQYAIHDTKEVRTHLLLSINNKGEAKVVSEKVNDTTIVLLCPKCGNVKKVMY